MIRPAPYPVKNPTVLNVGDGSSTVTIYGPTIYIDSGGTGTLTMGDVNDANNSTKIEIDDNALHLRLRAGVNKVGSYDSTAGVVTIGDIDGVSNVTTVVIDDLNSRVLVGGSTSKVVSQNPAGIYCYDAGTSTYWQWASVNGVWTGTNTGSGSLP